MDEVNLDTAPILPPVPDPVDPTPYIGPPGPPNALTIGTVTTGTPGSAADAQITGSSPTQVLDLTIPAGAPGSDATIDIAASKFLARDSTEPAASEHDVSDLALDVLAESTAAGMRGKVDAAATLHTHTLDQVGDYPLDAGSFPTKIIGAKTGDSVTEFNVTITATSAEFSLPSSGSFGVATFIFPKMANRLFSFNSNGSLGLTGPAPSLQIRANGVLCGLFDANANSSIRLVQYDSGTFLRVGFMVSPDGVGILQEGLIPNEAEKTFAGAPSAAALKYGFLTIEDSSGVPKPCWSDGTNWIDLMTGTTLA